MPCPPDRPGRRAPRPRPLCPLSECSRGPTARRTPEDSVAAADAVEEVAELPITMEASARSSIASIFPSAAVEMLKQRACRRGIRPRQTRARNLNSARGRTSGGPTRPRMSIATSVAVLGEKNDFYLPRVESVQFVFNAKLLKCVHAPCRIEEIAN